MENTTKTNGLNYFVLVFALISMLSGLHAFSPLGGQCNYSRDCAQGYCNQSVCKVPDVLENYNVVGTCNSTIDCFNGFCLSGQCVLPKTQSFNVLSLGSGLQSSCAGIIDNCTGFWCMFCNITWIILLIGAALAAFITRKSGRVLPLLLFALPLAAGIIFFPFLGSILAVVEILIIAFLKPALLSLNLKGLLQGLNRPKQPPAEPPVQPPAVPQQPAENKPAEGKESGQLPFD